MVYHNYLTEPNYLSVSHSKTTCLSFAEPPAQRSLVALLLPPVNYLRLLTSSLPLPPAHAVAYPTLKYLDRSGIDLFGLMFNFLSYYNSSFHWKFPLLLVLWMGNLSIYLLPSGLSLLLSASQICLLVLFYPVSGIHIQCF